MLKDYDLKQLVSPLLQWFLNHARVLPWREEPTPYRVWVSEIMLQQTRVEAVKPYFERFTTALPDAKALAVCPEDELLKLWEGLGYYNRVRNMQKAAVEVVEYYGGQLPADYEKLLKLKGIGHYTKLLAKALHVIGLINIQFIVYQDEVYVIEVNPRSSRTVPYISKVTGIPIVDLASRVILGAKIRDLGYEPGLAPKAAYLAIKMPVFSFEKLRGAEISLGPEMKSTGECLGIAKTFNEALYKAFLGAGVQLPKYKQMIMTVKDADKPEAVGVAKRFEALGYKIYATRSTAKYLQEHGVNALRINKISQESPNVMDLILGHKIDLVIDTPTQGNGDKNRDGFLIRRNAIETGVYCITAMDTANALAQSLETATNELTPIDIATVKNL